MMDLRRADLALLVSLDALLGEQSVTAAARRLGISQPALSAQLARLRDLFGDALLVGNAHGMVLTPRAEELREPLRAILSDLRSLVSESAGFDPASDARTVRLAATDLAQVFILPRLYAALAEKAPNITVEGVPLVVDQVADAMKRGEVDLALSSRENAPPDFPSRRLRSEEYHLIWREGHPMPGPPTTVEAFCALCHLVISIKGGSVLGDVDEALERIGRRRRIAGSVPNFLLAPHVVRNADIVAVVPAVVAAIDGAGIRHAPLPFATSRLDLYLSWHPRMRNDVGHRWLRDLVIAVAQTAV
jgi:DNA-binding transcriptional LysR family regulator